MLNGSSLRELLVLLLLSQALRRVTHIDFVKEWLGVCFSCYTVGQTQGWGLHTRSDVLPLS
jgi:hypothetical protein